MTLRVRLEIIPSGEEEEAYEIGCLDIINEGRTGIDKCIYGVIDLNKNEEGYYTKHILHSRTEGAWELLRKIITELKLKGPFN